MQVTEPPSCEHGEPTDMMSQFCQNRYPRRVPAKGMPSQHEYIPAVHTDSRVLDLGPYTYPNVRLIPTTHALLLVEVMGQQWEPVIRTLQQNTLWALMVHPMVGEKPFCRSASSCMSGHFQKCLPKVVEQPTNAKECRLRPYMCGWSQE